MAPRITDALKTVFIFIILSSVFTCSAGDSENDRDFEFCGKWRNGGKALKLTYNLSPGCAPILISANESSLSIEGQITAQCNKSGVISLDQSGPPTGTHFCLFWEPLLDQLQLQVGGETHKLCEPAGLQQSCCTNLSPSSNEPETSYGIINGSIKGDVLTSKSLAAYGFFGESINCKEQFCDKAIKGPTQVNMIEEAVMRSETVGSVELPCALSSVVVMKEDFQGSDIVLTASPGLPPESIPSIHLPPSLRPPTKTSVKVVCTIFKNSSFFQEGGMSIVDNVVGISVENEIIRDLSEPIRIGFHHRAIHRTFSRKCVSWDTRKDPLKVNWLDDGCLTKQKGEKETECHCNHLTYFTVLVEMEPRPVRHLLALTAITSLGCAVSVISCLALIIFLCRKRKCKEQSIPIHLGLAMSLLFLNLLFFLTGTLANLGEEALCRWVGAGLHYALLSSFTWMALEVFQTFRLVYLVFTPPLKPYIWGLIGFGFPALPVVTLAMVGDIYGVREVAPSDDVSNPYQMCWMKNNHKALLAHYFTNVTVLAILVFSGLVMLFLVYRQIRRRDEWKQNQVAFLSIWGLSCLFGTTWGLTFLNFGPLSDIILFLSCILNSFQGFFLVLRFYMLGWMRKQTGGSTLGTSSTGSTRQHMLQPQEKS
ncbi:adhesion G-protein coupled receptor G5-like [Myripristis murdjan]|uniref:Adhesion G protein-coupled receptor G1 n=1 Tax=Myripristis murdjan TaxID=586833 RepID=A0A668AZS7_9TELE|nr:adhesion G-protein coupled receptor G5-like [Myripristis murdjan]